MNGEIFVNEAFTHALKTYVDNKNRPESVGFNSFYAVIIRQLAFIYDELDIVNPYNILSEPALNNNLKKYGLTQEQVDRFENTLSAFYKNENESDFVSIEKQIIDMFMKKHKSVKLTNSQIDSFRELLYSPNSINSYMVSYNFMMNKNPFEFINYYNNELEKVRLSLISKPKETLNLEAYEILKYSLSDIDAMNSDQLDKVNKEVYNYFEIDSNALNKDYLLDQAVYDYNHPKPVFSTGNGYIDILLVVGIISIIVLVIVLLTVFVF